MKPKGEFWMFKKIMIAGLCFLLTFCTACGKGKDVIVENGNNSSAAQSGTPGAPTTVYYLNPLTGEKNLTLEESKQQPAAIMINNIDFAQPKQSGVYQADIVYETEVEGGVTRLMAVFQNIGKAARLGSIRSARFVYVDLALGHNAVYFHCGQDPVYCEPHLKNIEHYTIETDNVGKRINNGLAWEHRVYADGIDIHNTFMKDKTVENITAWQDFAADGVSVNLKGGSATDVSVPFSTSYISQFKYDAENGKYTRYFRGNATKNYESGELTQVTNVFVLSTAIYNYPDGKHRYVDLEGGDGYYFSNGTYTPIKWQKGAAKNSIKFTNTDGTTLTVNQGNSWVCITNKSNKITIK